MDSVSRRSFIGVVSSFFLLRKPIKLDSHNVIIENIVLPKSKYDKFASFIPLYKQGKRTGLDFVIVPLSGAKDSSVDRVIEEVKSYKGNKNIYIYKLFNEEGKLLNVFGAGSPFLLGDGDVIKRREYLRSNIYR